MKKEYKKPYLALESFQVEAAIAGSCAGKVTLNHYLSTCVLGDDEGEIWDFIFGRTCGEQGGIDVNVEGDAPCYQAFAYNDSYLAS